MRFDYIKGGLLSWGGKPSFFCAKSFIFFVGVSIRVTKIKCKFSNYLIYNVLENLRVRLIGLYF